MQTALKLIIFGGDRLVFSGSATIPEDTVVGSTLGTLSVAGVPGYSTFTFGTGEQGSTFGLTGSTVTLDGALDYATKASYSLIFLANGTGLRQLTLNQTFLVGSVATTGQAVGLLLALTKAA